MGPFLLSVAGSLVGAAAGRVFEAKKNLPGVSLGEPKQKETQMSIYGDEEVGADDIYIETSGADDDDVGAAKARPKAKSAKGRNAYRRIAFIPGTSIGSASTSVLPVVLNAPFKGVGLRIAGANQALLFFTGAVIRGRPQEGSSGSVGCDIFGRGETFFWEWDTANPGENFTLGFTNTHTAAVVPTGFLIGYLAP